MSSVAEIYISPEEYLERERQSEEKSEYYGGRIYAMSGASRPHNLITGNVFASLHTLLRGGPCEVYVNDMKVRIKPTGAYVYPDVFVACGELQFDDTYKDVLLNPVLVIEVLSPSTEAHDRGLKFALYRQLDSLQDYLLIAQDRVSVVHYHRKNGEWIFNEYNDLNDRLALEAIGCTLPVAEMYERIELEETGRG
jgi:Uma2 family endonuclease